MPGRFSAAAPASLRACCLAVATLLTAVSSVALATDYRTTTEAATVLYDAPSARARPRFVYGRDVPLEMLVSVEGWTKVRDMQGAIGWVANKALSDKRMLVVRVGVADVRSAAEESAPIVFRAEQNVLLELAEPATSASATANPGWVKVRHRDGQTGFVRVAQVFGL